MPARERTLNITVTNDGTPELGRLSNRAAHGVLIRLNLGPDHVGDSSKVGTNALFGSGESATTYGRMFQDISEYHSSFKKLQGAARILGYTKCKVLVCVDGAAMVRRCHHYRHRHHHPAVQ